MKAASAEDLLVAAEQAPVPYPSAGVDPAARTGRKIRIPELDALRFLAALGVVFYHYTYRHVADGSGTQLFSTLSRATAFGYLGVNLFFMISGFVVLWTARERRPTEFVVARMARLYPEFWIAVILSSVAFTLLPGAHPRPSSLSMVAANLTMVPRLFHHANVDNVYWTLFLELKFYAFLWCLSLARQIARIERWLYAWLLVTSYCFLFAAPATVRILTLQPYAPLFIAGCLFFLVRASGWSALRISGLMACLALCLWHARLQLQSYVSPAEFTEAAKQKAMWVIAGFFVLFGGIALRKSVVRPTATVAFLGALTYPLYLLHNIAKTAMPFLEARFNPYLVLAAAILFSAGLAAGVVWLVERSVRKPFARVLTQVIDRAVSVGAGWLARVVARSGGRWRRRRVIGWAVVLGIGFAAGTEGILRMLGFGHPLLLQTDPNIGYLFQANQQVSRLGRDIRINGFHQRSEEVSPLPPANGKRVLVVGDSVTFGTTLLNQDETISERIKAELGLDSAILPEVLNASAGSWAPGNELAYLQRFGVFGAQWVVLQIGSHDLLQAKSTSARVGVDPAMPDRRPPTAVGEVWARYIWPRLRGATAPAYPAPPEGDAAAAQFDANMRSLSEMIRLIRQSGAIPLVLHTPNRDEVATAAGASNSPYTKWRGPFLAQLEAQTVPVINLAELWAHDRGVSGYYLDHVHLSALGAATAARAVTKQIESAALWTAR